MFRQSEAVQLVEDNVCVAVLHKARSYTLIQTPREYAEHSKISTCSCMD